MNGSFKYQIRPASRTLLHSVAYAALGLLVGALGIQAQTVVAQQTPQTVLPPVTITAPEVKRRADSSPARVRATHGNAKPRSQTARRPQPAEAPKQFAVSQDARTGTVGYYSDSTSVGTKTNTPLLDIPQSVSVLTKDFIQDQSTHSVTDLTRYVPGVAVHQGEGNRDELVIRGVDSSANFFVNGFRDDVQYYRTSTIRRALKC